MFPGQSKEFRFSFFFFSLLYIGVGCVLVVWGGQPKVRAPTGQLGLIRGLYHDARVGPQPKSENGFLDSGVFGRMRFQLPTWGWSLVLLEPLKIENWAPYGRF